MFLFVALLTASIATTSDESVTPFTIRVPDQELKDLQTKLALTKLPDTMASDKNWTYGTDLTYMKELLEFWKNDFDWRKEEAKLNEMPQFQTTIDGLTIHFVHARSPHPQAQPLIMVHGWPGSFWECHKVLPMWTDPTKFGGKPEDAFHVVCPSIPGYGFSSAPTEPGFDQIEAAQVFIKLMKRLGYGDGYWTQGGDWGAIVTMFMTTLDDAIIGHHTNFPQCSPQFGRGIMSAIKTAMIIFKPSWFVPEEEVAFVKRRADLGDLATLTGYLHHQATKPQTLGYPLSDSPIGLAAYIIEKFRQWSDCNGALETRFTKSEILTNVMIYWVSGTITSSMRFYYELFSGKNQVFQKLITVYVSKPCGIANFPAEIQGGVRVWADMVYNVQQWSVFSSGGHFAALEEPALLAKDVWAFRKAVQKSKTEKTEI